MHFATGQAILFFPKRMLRNYFKIAWRSLLNNRGYSAINIGGLALALGIGILLLWWVQDELSYDRLHAQGARIYRVNGGFGTGSTMSRCPRS